MSEPTKLALSALRPSPANPRKRFEGLEDLAQSIRAHGVLSPLVVRMVSEAPQVYEIVAGERRFRAAPLAGLKEVPVVVRELTDSEAAQIAVLENIQRDALTPLEEADGFRTLIETHGLSAQDVANRVGKSRSYVANRLAIAHAGPEVRAALEAGTIGASVALVLARLPEAAQAEALNRCGERPSVDDAMHAAQASARMLCNAPFDRDDLSLSPSDGACSDCPRRTGGEPNLFGADGDDVCLDGECWRRKCGVAFVRLAADHPGKVLTAEEAAKVFGHYGVGYTSGYVRLNEEKDYFSEDPKAVAALEKLPVVLAQNPITGQPERLVERAKVDAIRRKHIEKPAKPAPSAPKQNEAQRAADAERKRCEAADAERKRCEAAGAALIAAAVADRKNAVERLVGLGRAPYGDDFEPLAMSVAGATKQTSLGKWARNASKDDLAAFLLADRLEGAYCGGAEQVRALAAKLDLPVPEGFAMPKAKAGKRGAR